MKKRKLAVTAAALGAVLVILAVLMAVPQCRWAVLSVVSRKPVCPECGYLHVIHDYYEATGISRDTLGATPAEVMEMYGEPENIGEEFKGEGHYSQIYNYGDFAIIFQSRIPGEESAEDCQGVGFIIYSPDMEIRYDIHVGSARKQIINAYRKCPSIVYPVTNEGEIGDWLYDNGMRNFWKNSLSFSYDRNDIVTAIEYYP